MATWDALRDLPVEIDAVALDGLELALGSFDRLTTIVRLSGGGEEGAGEDVTYDALDHFPFRDSVDRFQALAGTHTLASFADAVAGLDLFPGGEPNMPVSRTYRRWAFESAALDLALVQAGRSLGDVVGREPRPLNYVVSMRLAAMGDDEPERIDRLAALLERYPGTRFKLDPTRTWSDELIAELIATGAVDSVDLKGHYKGTPVDVETDPELYRRVAEAFPDAWIEDPDLTDPEAAKVLEPYRDRITWDAPIHSVADIEALSFPPKVVNVKPSRFGSLQELCAAYDYCDEQGIGAYGGGQTELGVGRDQIQYLAALFHPDTPNDTAPKEFNMPQAPEGLPASPIDLPIAESGLRFSRPLFGS